MSFILSPSLQRCPLESPCPRTRFCLCGDGLRARGSYISCESGKRVCGACVGDTTCGAPTGHKCENSTHKSIEG